MISNSGDNSNRHGQDSNVRKRDMMNFKSQKKIGSIQLPNVQENIAFIITESMFQVIK